MEMLVNFYRIVKLLFYMQKGFIGFKFIFKEFLRERRKEIKSDYQT
jgi:pilus assembly protein TadC